MFPWNQLDPLTHFVWREHLHQASEMELRICVEFSAECTGRRIEDLEEILQASGKTLPSRDDAAYLLQNGSAEALRSIARQLLRDHPERFDTSGYLEKIRPFRIHYCPQCRGELRTPEARQCFECGYDWHSGPDHQLTWKGMDYVELRSS